jgi:hypothetical protein
MQVFVERAARDGDDSVMATKKTNKKSSQSNAKKSSSPKKSTPTAPKRSKPAAKAASRGAASKAAAKPKKRAAAKRSSSPALSSSDRQSLVKPPEAYAPLVEQSITAWQQNSRTVRIDGRSPAQLARAYRKAARARQREDELRDKLALKLRPLTDARLRAEDELWTQVLDLYRVVKATMPMRPELEQAFDHLASHFAPTPTRKKDAPAAGTPSTPPGDA